MRTLVTGGLGYIGHAVCSELRAAGYDVTATTRTDLSEAVAPSGVSVVACDMRDGAALTELVVDGRFDSVVHLAGLARTRESFDVPLAYFDVNVGGAVNLLEALDKVPPSRRPSLLYGSTTLVYGSRYVGVVDENSVPDPESPYADTKLAVERLVAAQANAGNLAAAVLRIFNVGGGYDGVGDTDPTRIIPNLLRAATGETDGIDIVGHGRAMRDFVHVADVAAAIRSAMAAVHPGTCPIFNVGSGVGTRIIDVAHCVEEVSGCEINMRSTAPEGSPSRLVADIGYALRRLDWAPQRSDLHTIIEDAWACWPRAR